MTIHGRKLEYLRMIFLKPVLAGLLLAAFGRICAGQDWSPNMTLGPAPPTPTSSGAGGYSRPAYRGPSQAELDRRASIDAYNAENTAYKLALSNGDQAYLQGRFEDARAQYEYMTRLRPNGINPYRMLGLALIREGRYAEAEAALLKALDNGLYKPQWAKYVAYLTKLKAQDCASRKDYAGAAALYVKALRLNPDDDWAWNELGLMENNQGDYSNAEAHFGKAIKLKPDPLYQTNLQVARAQQTQNAGARNIQWTARKMARLTGEASGAGRLGIDDDRSGNATANVGQSDGQQLQVVVQTGLSIDNAGLAARSTVVSPLASRKPDAQLESVLSGSNAGANTRNMEAAYQNSSLGIDTPGEDSGALQAGALMGAPGAIREDATGHLGPLETNAANQLASLRAERSKLDAKLQDLTNLEAHEKDTNKMAALDVQVLKMQAEKAKNAVAITEGEEKVRKIHQSMTLIETPESRPTNPAATSQPNPVGPPRLTP